MTNSRKNIVFGTLSIIGIVIAALVIVQVHKLRVAHSSFDNYYAFRGCTKLIAKTDTSGVCMTSDGQIIGIDQYGDKWYLEGDGPGKW